MAFLALRAGTRGYSIAFLFLLFCFIVDSDGNIVDRFHDADGPEICGVSVAGDDAAVD